MFCNGTHCQWLHIILLHVFNGTADNGVGSSAVRHIRMHEAIFFEQAKKGNQFGGGVEITVIFKGKGRLADIREIGAEFFIAHISMIAVD